MYVPLWYLHRQFGFTDGSSISTTPTGPGERGEEHEVTLIWSLMSGKTKVLWNKEDISDTLTNRHVQESSVGASDKVEFQWETTTGETITIQAHANQDPARPQYDLQIDGMSFFRLPHISDLSGQSDDASAVTCEANWFDLSAEVASEIGLDQDSLTASRSVTPTALHTSTSASVSLADELAVRDELTVDIRSSPLETLRRRVTVSIPTAEEMVSRAIIKAFSTDHDISSTSYDSNSSCGDLAMHHSLQYEADAVKETFAWTSLNVDYNPQPDVDEQKDVFLQKQIDSMFMHVRHGQLSTESAERILISTAIILGIRINTSVPRDTLILDDLDPDVGVEQIIDCLCSYGDIKGAALAKGHRFAICRFVSESGASRSMTAYENGSLSLGNKAPIISILTPLIADRPPTFKRGVSEPSRKLMKPELNRRRSHQRNSIIIDTSIPELGIQTLLVDEGQGVVTPDSSASSSFLQPNVFKNIPARSPSQVWDAPEDSSPFSTTHPITPMPDLGGVSNRSLAMHE